MKKIIIILIVILILILGGVILFWKYTHDHTLDKNGMENPDYKDIIPLDGDYTYVANEVLLEVIEGTWNSADGHWKLTIGKEYELKLEAGGECVLEDTLNYTYLQPGPVSQTEFRVNTPEITIPDGEKKVEIGEFFHKVGEGRGNIILEIVYEDGREEMITFS